MPTGHPLLEALSANGRRLTGPRMAVAGLIAARQGHFTAADIVADPRARRDGIGRATIFRALDLFVELGTLERLDLPNGEHAYVSCQPSHHHHVVCSGCGRSTDIEDEGLKEFLKGVALRTGYAIDRHRLELYGLCPACRDADRESR